MDLTQLANLGEFIGGLAVLCFSPIRRCPAKMEAGTGPTTGLIRSSCRRRRIRQLMVGVGPLGAVNGLRSDSTR